ncbi:equilibrative nucleobase transporter 1-like [Littorina saxatilis]|uniref:equilibrative nucleobase transporter 1-like n=1 Tax=Littorina saxatilis TaxID=31220 RepID=UPI0038B48A29
MNIYNMETKQARKWRWLIFASASLETILFGGIVFGWSSLVYVLKQDGVFYHLCNDVNVNYSHVVVNVGILNLSHALNQSTTLSSFDYSYGYVTNDSFSKPRVYSSPTDDVSDAMTSGVLMTCDAQDNMLSLCFSVSSGILYTAASIVGAMSYKLGTRTTRLVGWLTFTVGGLLTAFTSPEIPWLLFAGLPIIGFGGVVLLITNIQVGTLFDTGSSTVIAAICGLFDTSSVVMLFVKEGLHCAQSYFAKPRRIQSICSFPFASEAGFSRRNSLLVLTGLHVLTLLSTMLLMPRTHFAWSDVPKKTVDIKPLKNGDAADTEPLNEHRKEGSPTHLSNDKFLNNNGIVNIAEHKKYMPTLRECVLSTMYIFEVAWIALLQLRFSYFLVSINPWLTHRLHTEQQVSHFTNVSMYSMMCGLLVSLLSGAIFDFFKHIFAKQPTLEGRHLYPSVAMLCITSAVSMLMSVTVLIHTIPSLYAAFVFTALLRSFLYSVDANVVTLIFPPEYFGAMFGVSDLVGGAVSTLQYALVLWHEYAGFDIVNYAMLVITAVTFVHPAVQLCRGLRIGNSYSHVPLTTTDPLCVAHVETVA